MSSATTKVKFKKQYIPTLKKPKLKMAGIKINSIKDFLEEKIKELYLAKNIEDLQKKIKDRLTVPGLNCDILVKVSQRVWITAKESLKNGDQEMAYVCYFLYCDLAYRIRNSLQYAKDKLYYDCVIITRSVEEALDYSRTLIVQLKKRYDERQTKQDQIQSKYIINLEVLEFEKEEEEKEMNEKWEINFSVINSLMKSDSFSDVCPLERRIIRLEKRLSMYEDQYSKQSHKIAGLQESLKIYKDQNLDLQDSRLCKICMDQEVSQVLKPCNHVVCCNNCITNIETCPICRKNIENSEIIYFS